MLRTSVSPNIINGGYRINVIPSEAKATIDVRAAPDEDPAKFLELVKRSSTIRPSRCGSRCASIRRAAPDRELDSDAFKAIEAAVTEHYNASRCRR